MLQYIEIRQLGKVITGKTPPTEEENNFGGDIPFITPSDIKGFDDHYVIDTERTISEKGSKYLKKNLLPKDSICFVCIGSTIGKMCITGIPSYTNQQLNSIIPFSTVDNHYLFYLLRYFKGYFQLLGGGTGSGKGIVKKSTFEKSKILYDDNLDNQKRIASILSAYDSQIETNQKRIKLLEQMAECLYKEWFVRFRFPGYENTEFEEGLPKGWEIKKLKQFVTFFRGKTYSSEDIASGDYVLLSMNNIRSWGGYIRDDSRVFGGAFKDYQLLKKGDLIMSITDMTQDRRIIGYVGIFDEERNDCIMSTHLMKIVSEYNNYYLYGLFNFSLSRTISEYATGANVLGLTDKILKEIKALVPTNDLISMYGNTVKPFWEEIFHLKDEIAILTHQRDLLLPRLMSGKLSI